MDDVEKRLFEAVVTSPDDDGPRAVYGDWFQSRGDVRGEIIALQLSGEPQALARAEQLVDERWQRLLAPLQYPFVTSAKYRRGFPAELLFGTEVPRELETHYAFGTLEAFELQEAPKENILPRRSIFPNVWRAGILNWESAARCGRSTDASPIQHLGVSCSRRRGPSPEQLEAIGRGPGLARLRRIDVDVRWTSWDIPGEMAGLVDDPRRTNPLSIVGIRDHDHGSAARWVDWFVARPRLEAIVLGVSASWQWAFCSTAAEIIVWRGAGKLLAHVRTVKRHYRIDWPLEGVLAALQVLAPRLERVTFDLDPRLELKPGEPEAIEQWRAWQGSGRNEGCNGSTLTLDRGRSGKPA